MGEGSTHGKLILGATPIGNVGDATSRLNQALQTADVVAAEDTRRVLELVRRLSIKMSGKLVSLHDHNEAARTPEIIEALLSGSDVLVVSDAGMPMINDPGYKLVQAAIAAKIPVTCLPGPSAPLAALVLSGLATHKFCFEGFLPPKSVSRQNALRLLVNESRTIIFLESTHRIAKTIADMAQVFGINRRACIARELTKPYEEIIRGTLGELIEITSMKNLKGEMCIVVEGLSQQKKL